VSCHDGWGWAWSRLGEVPWSGNGIVAEVGIRRLDARAGDSAAVCSSGSRHHENGYRNSIGNSTGNGIENGIGSGIVRSIEVGFVVSASAVRESVGEVSTLELMRM
jgi:hypothetical protein